MGAVHKIQMLIREKLEDLFATFPRMLFYDVSCSPRTGVGSLDVKRSPLLPPLPPQKMLKSHWSFNIFEHFY